MLLLIVKKYNDAFLLGQIQILKIRLFDVPFYDYRNF